MALDMDQGDWIPVFRKLRDNWIWKDAEMLRAWLDLLMMANRRESLLPHAGRLLPIEPGQLPTTYQALAKRWSWSRDRVQRFLNHLADAESVSFRRVKFQHKIQAWVSTNSDRSIMILTLINSPVRQRWLAEHAQQPADNIAGTRQKTGSRPADDVADDQQQLKQYPRGLNGGEGGEGDNNNKNPHVDTTSHVAPKQGAEGTGAGVVVAVSEATGAKEPSNPPPPLQNIKNERLLKQASTRLGTPILEAIGVDGGIAEHLARAHPAVRILDVAEHAKKQTNPGGFARMALEQGWIVPAANGEGLSKLLTALEAEAGANDERWRRAGGGGLLKKDPEFQRREGETEDEHLRRVSALIQRRKTEARSETVEGQGATDE